MGGATSINQGIYIEETPEWFIDQVHQTTGGASFFDAATIADAFAWNRDRVANEPSREYTETSGLYIQEYFTNLVGPDGGYDPVTEPSGLEGQPFVPDEGAWRTHSIFDNDGSRHSADKILDRTNDNLDVFTDTEVTKILFDDDDSGLLPPNVNQDKDDTTPSARCVLLSSGETICVKKKGRIYISAGAFHTPELLIKSGIGPQGDKAMNDQVCRNS